MEAKSPEGHRKRLRKRFNQSGLDAFLDYEIVELLLTLGTPRKDCKPQAKEAINRFKTLRGVLEAPSEELQKIKGITAHNVFVIKFLQEIAREFLKEALLPILPGGLRLPVPFYARFEKGSFQSHVPQFPESCCGNRRPL